MQSSIDWEEVQKIIRRTRERRRQESLSFAFPSGEDKRDVEFLMKTIERSKSEIRQFSTALEEANKRAEKFYKLSVHWERMSRYDG